MKDLEKLHCKYLDNNRNATCRVSASVFCLMIFFSAVCCKAQKLNIKPYFAYHQSISKQTEPVFHHIYFPNYHYNSEGDLFFDKGHRYDLVSSFCDDFTLANGWEYGVTVGYTFRNHLGFELGAGYFSGCCNSFKNNNWHYDIIMWANPISTDWTYHSIALRPLLSYSICNQKSDFMIKIGPTVHLAKATLIASLYDKKASICRFDKQWNWGYLIGLEYDYHLSDQFSLAIEMGFEKYTYTPYKATVEYRRYIYVPRKEEFIYVNNIAHEPAHERDENYLPQYKRQKESIFFNSLHFGIGIKYNLWKK